jgi:hypothetical protein
VHMCGTEKKAEQKKAAFHTPQIFLHFLSLTFSESKHPSVRLTVSDHLDCSSQFSPHDLKISP